LTLDLQDIINTYPSLEIWDYLDLQHIVTHYDGLGILPNVFPKYVDKSIIETYLPIYYTGSATQFSFSLKVYQQSNPSTPVVSTDNFQLFSVSYTLKLVSSKLYPNSIPVDFSSMLSVDSSTLAITQPVLDFYSPAVYELSAIYQDKKSTCHKIKRKYTFELKHILTSFIPKMSYTFTMGESLVIDVTTITRILPTHGIRSVDLNLCVPNIPNNKITDPLSCSLISNVLPSLSFVDFEINQRAQPLLICQLSVLQVSYLFQVTTRSR
jgi:hypothetical protein